jgi:hypothetical protein
VDLLMVVHSAQITDSRTLGHLDLSLLVDLMRDSQMDQWVCSMTPLA